MNERQALRRLKKRKEVSEKGGDRHEHRQYVREVGREAGLSLKKAIVARHEDWELGPLAPRRDAPKILSYNPTENSHYGTLTINRALSQVKLRPSDLEERCRWAGGPETLCLAEGDRVVITEGSHKGKIDKIASINLEYGTVRLADMKVGSNPHPLLSSSDK
jgi:large subunit ribosomal protein L24